MAELVYKPRAEFPDHVVMQDGHPIKISGSARWHVETDLLIARIGCLGVLRCSDLHNRYFAMGRRLLTSAEAAVGARKAWLTYWGNRHIEIADGFFEALGEQRDFAEWSEADDG